MRLAWITGTDGHLLAASRSLAERLRRPRRELIGSIPFEALPAPPSGLLRAEDRRILQARRGEVCPEPPNALHPTAWAVRVKYPLSDPEGRVFALSATLLPLGSFLPVEAILRRRFSPRARPEGDWLTEVRLQLDRSRRAPPLREIARGLALHPDYVGRMFLRRYGVTVPTYVRVRRVAVASNLLVTSNRPLVEVALDSGFYDQSHMTRECKRVLGATPAAYRRGRSGRAGPRHGAADEAASLDRVLRLHSPAELQSLEAAAGTVP